MTTQTPDPLDAIRAWAPSTRPDPRSEVWSDDEVDAVFARVLDRADDAVPFRARHRGVVAAGAAAVVAFAGVGVAAAAGVPAPASVLRSFDQLFSDPHRGPGSYPLADPATARRVFAIPGPEGTRFEGWTAGNSHGGLCVTSTFRAAGGDDSPPADLTTGGAQCAVADAPHGLFAEGYGSELNAGAADRVDFVWQSGDAVRAELRVSTGKVYPVAIQDGWLGGWYGIDEIPLGATATIVAYGADGTELGRFVAQDQAGCPDARPC